ncbi:MAG: amidohydrolase [Candidatus Rokuibacteriota bacterium]
MSKVKTIATDWLDGEADRIDGLSRRIWQMAEPALHEKQSATVLVDALRAAGFRVDEAVASIPTAFTASWGEGSPTIGFLAEYDALPGLSNAPEPRRSPVVEGGAGHGCGHNLIGTGSTAAAIAASVALRREGRPGTIKVFGTPAEETLVGKVFMVRAGIFDGLDAALTWHPQHYTRVADERCLALLSVRFAFHGRTCHIPSAPEAGRNALDAVELMNVAVNMRRKHMSYGVTIEYVVTEGGAFPNVTPALARVWYFIRSPRVPDVEAVYAQVQAAARGAALATGTTVESRMVTSCYGYLPNTAMADLLYQNLHTVGAPRFSREERSFATELVKTVVSEPPSEATVLDGGLQRVGDEVGPYSQDDGDLSWLTPLNTFHVAAWPNGVPAHTWQAAASCGTTIGTKAMMSAARTLAHTGLDLFTDAAALARVRAEFRERTKGFVYRSLVPAEVSALDSLNP